MLFDPFLLFLKSSEPLRRAAESNDPAELKGVMLHLADEFDRVRALMPTSACVIAEDVARVRQPPHLGDPQSGERAG